MKLAFAFSVAVLSMVTLQVVNTSASEAMAKKMGGWEKGGAYDKAYNPSELEQFRATVVKVTTLVPMPGMAPGVALVVKEAEEDDETILVHVCPEWYMDGKGIGIRKGDRLKIRGSWAEIDGKDIFMASKIKRGDYFVLKVRLTKDGTPFWTLSPEEIAREQATE
jgi:hypothetical protein